MQIKENSNFHENRKFRAFRTVGRDFPILMKTDETIKYAIIHSLNVYRQNWNIQLKRAYTDQDNFALNNHKVLDGARYIFILFSSIFSAQPGLQADIPTKSQELYEQNDPASNT